MVRRFNPEQRAIRRWRKSLVLVLKARDVAAYEGRGWAAQSIACNAGVALFHLGGLMGEW
jgi:hypothetical protein